MLYFGQAEHWAEQQEGLPISWTEKQWEQANFFPHQPVMVNKMWRGDAKMTVFI